MRVRTWCRYGLIAAVLVLPVTAGAAVSDAWITTKAKIALLSTPGVSSTAVNVDTIDGAVTLHGKVESLEEKGKAEEEVRRISGVKEVRNLLQVVPAQREKAVKLADRDIDQRVWQALEDDPSLKDSSIAVQSVNDGVVLLGGKASSVSAHLRALEVARAVPGVRSVRSEVESPDGLADDELHHQYGRPEAGTRGVGQTLQDMYITSATKMRLLADEKTPALDINVDTRNGVVTLFGTVPTAAAKEAAESDARKVSAVRRVVNELEVVPHAVKERVQARDEDLKDQVKKNLENRQDLKDASIDVEVRNGVARLTGTIKSEQQRLAAAIAARSTPGVRAVHDDLRMG